MLPRPELELYQSLCSVIECGRKYAMVADDIYTEFQMDRIEWIQRRCYNRRLTSSKIWINALVVYPSASTNALINYAHQHNINICHHTYIGSRAMLNFNTGIRQVRTTFMTQRISSLKYLWYDGWSGHIARISYKGLVQVLTYAMPIEFEYEEFNRMVLDFIYHAQYVDQVLLE